MKRRPDVEWVTVAFLTLVSLGVRLSVVARGPFPLNDGGLFYAFISDLLADSLRLPEFSSYNAAGIPFVYPPLAFVVTAGLHLASKIPVLVLLQYVPAVVSAAAIPAFFGLATHMLDGRRQPLLATFVFSMLPRAFDWLIMGGGITRGFGLLFYLLFLTQAVRLFAKGDRGAALPAVLFGGLLILSHPEAAVHGAITAALLVAWYQRTRTGIGRSALLVLGTLVITCPWWLLVLTRHGFGPWLSGLTAVHQDTYHPLLGLIAILRFDFTDEPFLRLFGVLGLLGFVVLLAGRKYFLASWFVLLQLVEPRGGALFMMIPLAMSAGQFLDSALLATLQSAAAVAKRAVRAKSPGTRNPPPYLASTPATRIFFAFLFLYGTVSAYYVGMRLQQDVSLASRDLAALEWVSGNTAAGDRFVLVTGGEPLLDATSDWFPAITGRRSVASFFGAEWIPGLDFADGLRRYEALQTCLSQDSQCVKEWASAAVEQVNYVYVRAPDPGTPTVLQESLELDADFRARYSENGVEIFEWVAQRAH